jgi:hypothetical protein
LPAVLVAVLVAVAAVALGIAVDEVVAFFAVVGPI